MTDTNTENSKLGSNRELAEGFLGRVRMTPASLADDGELDQLKNSLEPDVLGDVDVPLSVGYVPRGPETLHDHDQSSRQSQLEEEEEELENLEAEENRFSGVIHAARFFVTRVGFLRSPKRLMVLSSNHLTIVDPYSDEVKERYAYDSIKEITLASDNGHSVDKSFTIYIGKNLKDTYSCRNRQHLLSAYYQLRERASSFRKQQFEGSASGMDVGESDMSSMGSSNTLNSSGMYFDSLFQLCGKTFNVTKLSTTRSTLLNPVKVDCLLAVRATSMDRLDRDDRSTLSSILLIDVVKVQRVTSNASELIVYFEHGRVHRYWSDSREPLIQALANNLRSWLNVTLFVEDVSDAADFDALMSTRDIPQPVAFEVPVFKISKQRSNRLQLRLLGLSTSGIVERDAVTRRTLAVHSLSDIFNVVMYPSLLPTADEEDDNRTEGVCGKFAIEFKQGRTRRFVCMPSIVCRRDRDVGLGLMHATKQHQEELLRSLRDIANEQPAPSWLNVAGAATVLSAKEARSLFLSNLFEMARMNKLHLSWSTEETQVACKEGTWGTDIHPEFEDILLRKLVSLSLVPNLVTQVTFDYIFRQLEQFNRNVPIGGLRQRDRRAFASLMKLLENFKEYSVAQLNSPSSSDAPIPPASFQVALLGALQRLLCTRGVFEEIPSSQYRGGVEVVMELLHSPMEEVSVAAAAVLKFMVVNYSDTRSMKSETANRRAVFTRRHARLFIARVLDFENSNRVGRATLPPIEDASVQRSVANALSFSQLGLDVFVSSFVLQTLEACLGSGKKATPERVSQDLLRAMRVEDFNRHHALFLLTRSMAFSSSKCAAVLVKVHVLEQPTELVELLQNSARKHGALLWQLYLSLYAQDKAQRRISSQLVALLTHENSRSSFVIRNVFPAALLNDMPVQDLEFDEFGRYLPATGAEASQKARNAALSSSHKSRSNGNSVGLTNVHDITNATDSGRSRLGYGLNSYSRLVRSCKCVVLLPEFFDRVWTTVSSRDLVWGPRAVQELVRKVEAELASLDLYRLQYQCYLYTDPLAVDASQSNDTKDLSSSGIDGLHHVAPFPFESVYDGIATRISNELRKGAISARNRFVRYMPYSFVVNGRDESDEEQGDAGSDSDDNSVEDGTITSDARKNSNQDNGQTGDQSVETSDNRMRHVKRRKKKGKYLPRWYVAWHSNEFRIEFSCLRDEVKVGPYYLAHLLNDRGALTEDVPSADKFMTLLYYRLLAEEGDEEPDDGARLLVLQVMIQLFERHYSQLTSLIFLNHLVRETMIDGASGGWPLVVRGNVALFLDRVTSSSLNVQRLLREEANVDMLIRLLEEVKPMVLELERRPSVEAPPSDGVDLEVTEDDEVEVVDGEEESDGETSEDTDLAKRTLEALEESDAESSVSSDASESSSQAEEEEEEAPFTVVAEHSGSMSGGMIMQTCLSVLSRLVDCMTAEEEGHMHQDVRFPKYGRLTHFEGAAVSPVSDIKRRLCEPQTLRFLVSLLECPNRLVFRKTLGLIRLLVRHHESIIPLLHATGLFYYLLRFAQDPEEMSVAARLLSHVHLRQSKLETPHALDDRQGGENKKGVFAPDPLTRICLRSWLVRLLPVSMVAQLLRHGPRRFAHALFSDSDNPEVVWNPQMRKQMVAYIEKFMARHTDEQGIFYISDDESARHDECVALIEYPDKVHALQCYQYYLHNLLDEKRFPGWPINDEQSFLDALMDSVHRWVHPEALLTAKGAHMSEGLTTKLLSVDDAIQLLDATALLLRRFPESSCMQTFEFLPTVLEALDKCVSETRNQTVDHSRSLRDISQALNNKSSFVIALASAVRVIDLAVSLSEENALASASSLGVRVLCSCLQLLFYNQDALYLLPGFDCQVVTHWVLQTLVHVFNQSSGRVSAATQSLDVLPCLTRFLYDRHDRSATDLSLQVLYEMAGSEGEMAEVLLLQLAEHGVVWYLTLLLFDFNRDDGDQHMCEGAARALARLLEANAQEEIIASYVKRMQSTIEKLLTRPLLNILKSDGPEKFLQIFTSDVREPHVMWTQPMRTELYELATRAVEYHLNKERSERNGDVFELPEDFEYEAQKQELCVAGIYVNFFNENPQEEIKSQIADAPTSGDSHANETRTLGIMRGFRTVTQPVNTTNGVSVHVLQGLLTALAQDLNIVRAQPSALESILLQRLLPEATAIRHLIQFAPDMDSEIVSSHGVITLLGVLDHEAQPQAFSFAGTAPLLQLRCVECLHMLAFSGRCLDPLATAVSPFVKSAFGIVYDNLAKTDASTEGQLARQTLQFLGNLCLIPACIDTLVRGMDPMALATILPKVWHGDPTEMQLLLCLHMIPLKRHTQAATEFTEQAVESRLAAALLNLLSSLVPKSKMGDSSQTKAYAAKFLSVLSANPGSGGAISSMLVSSRVWETYGESTQGSPDDLRRLLVVPHAPALLRAYHANPQKIGS